MDGKKEEEEDDKDVSEMNPTQRIHHLERSIGFLKQQHQEVLRCLHEEIEALKKENKGKELLLCIQQEIDGLKKKNLREST